jgi:hypothetical protein
MRIRRRIRVQDGLQETDALYWFDSTFTPLAQIDEDEDTSRLHSDNLDARELHWTIAGSEKRLF